MLLCVRRLATSQSAVTAGLAVGLRASARLSPRPAVVVEGMLGPSLHAEQTRRIAGGFLELSVQHRDVPVSGGLKFALTNPDLAVSAHAVALIGVSRHRTTLVGLRRTSFPPSAVAYETPWWTLSPPSALGWTW